MFLALADRFTGFHLTVLRFFHDPNVVDVAQHINRNAKKIDSALAAGSPEIVETIAWVSVPNKKDRNNFSFATKYCS
jgi:hypothetical protein